MFINKNSLKINGINFGQYLIQVDYGFNKIWSKDSGRNLAGSNSGTLVGIFPKIECTFRKLNQQELETIAPILDSPSQSVEYYDPALKKMTTISTYTGDWKEISKRIGRAEGVTCSFISNRRRTR